MSVFMICTNHKVRWCHWNFSVTHYGPGVHSSSNRNEYQYRLYPQYFLGVKAAGT